MAQVARLLPLGAVGAHEVAKAEGLGQVADGGVGGVVEDVDAAAAETDDDARRALFRRVVRAMALDLPALPLVYPISALATGPRVASYPTSPQLDEPFSRVRLTEG